MPSVKENPRHAGFFMVNNVQGDFPGELTATGQGICIVKIPAGSQDSRAIPMARLLMRMNGWIFDFILSRINYISAVKKARALLPDISVIGQVHT
ncbi:hypothetical protein CJA_3388 [Cellvibrio japonicus Ueda107]|uniref:Uncharacterized protein n=2 Tax=Cellvibrio japonicus TaxID=155077 RepID=B3PF74_CELJU|nr:hypothetical protein CJA_3388 [Cellvibrio japonicus Ueda107]